MIRSLRLPTSSSFGPFDAAFSNHRELIDPVVGPVFVYDAAAEQHSEIAGDGVTASGRVGAQGFIFYPFCPSCFPPDTRSDLALVFETSAPTAFRLTGSLTSQGWVHRR